MKINTKALAIGIIASLLIAGIGYSYYTYTQKLEKEAGIEVSVKEYSVKISGSICADLLVLPENSGDKNGLYTKSEKNRVYLSEKNTDPSLYKLQNLISTFKIEFPENCSCMGKSQVRVTVNGSAREDKLEYAWKDGDNILIEYR